MDRRRVPLRSGGACMTRIKSKVWPIIASGGLEQSRVDDLIMISWRAGRRSSATGGKDECYDTE